jgi:aminopeptidase-like protein
MRPIRAVAFDDIFDGVLPFLAFHRINIGGEVFHWVAPYELGITQRTERHLRRLLIR